MDIDYDIRKDKQPTLTDSSTAAKITLYNQWKRSNHVSAMFIRAKMSPNIRGSVAQHSNAKAFFEVIDAQFETSKKAHAMTLIMKFSSLKLTSVKGICEHIMQMRDIVAQLKNLEVEISESFLAHYIDFKPQDTFGPKILDYSPLFRT